MLKKLGLIAMMLFAISSAAPACGESSYLLRKVHDDSRNEWMYFIGGDKFLVLMQDVWGAVVYCPERLGSYRFRQSPGNLKLEGAGGTYSLSSAFGEIAVTYPKGTAKASYRANSGITILMNGVTYVSIKGSMNGLTVTLPGDTINYAMSVDRLDISGRSGVVKYKKGLDTYTIASAAGTTTYTSHLDGYTLGGIPPGKHPYRFWGIEIPLGGGALAMVVELRQFIRAQGLPSQLEFEDVLFLK